MGKDIGFAANMQEQGLSTSAICVPDAHIAALARQASGIGELLELSRRCGEVMSDRCLRAGTSATGGCTACRDLRSFPL